MIEVKTERADHRKRHVRVGLRRLRKAAARFSKLGLGVAEPAVEIAGENFRIGQPIDG
jgi:hypothetical protein